MKKRKEEDLPGYRQPETEDEKRFWGLYEPDYVHWLGEDNLSLDQLCALAIGLSPESIHSREFDGQAKARFDRTRDCLLEILAHPSFEIPTSFDGLLIWSWEFDFKLPPKLEALAGYRLNGLDPFNDDEQSYQMVEHWIASAKDRISLLQRRIVEMEAKLAKQKEIPTPSAKTRVANTDSRIIFALMLAQYADQERDEIMRKLKAGQNTDMISNAMNAVPADYNWFSRDTLEGRLNEALDLMRDNSFFKDGPAAIKRD